MDLHGALADVEIRCNYLVGVPLHDQFHDFFFTIGELVHVIEYLPLFAQNIAAVVILIKRVIDPVDQILVAERFLDKIQRAFFQRFDRHRYVAVAGDKNDRQNRVYFIQSILKFQTAHAGHSYIKHQATGDIIIVELQEFGCRSKPARLDSDRFHQETQ